MPRSNKRGAAGDTSGPSRRSSRTPAKAEPETVKKTRGASASSDASPSPAKSARKASPSPAPTSRGRAARGASKAEDSKNKGQGDQKGRVTRAVVKEKEEETSRGRSSSRKAEKAKEPAASGRTSRAKSGTPNKAAKATPQKKAVPRGGRSRSARGKKVEEAESEEEVEEEEEEEPEEEPPKKATPKSTPKGRGKTPAKTPTPKKDTTPKQTGSRSRSRGGNQDVTSPTVVLEKMDTSDMGGDREETEVKSPWSRRGRTSEAKATPSPSRSSRGRRSAQKEEEEVEEEKSEEGSEKEPTVEDLEPGKVEDSAKPEESTEPETKEESAETEEVTDSKDEELDADKENNKEDVAKQGEDEAVETKEDKSELDADKNATEKEDEEKDAPEEVVEKNSPEEVVGNDAQEEENVEQEQHEKEDVENDHMEEYTGTEPEPEKTDEPQVEEQPQVPSINITTVPDAEASDNETASSTAVEPPNSVQISEDSCSVEEVELAKNEVVQEAMEVEANDNPNSNVNQVDGEQNGDAECRKRKIEEVDEVEENTDAKKACVSEEQIQENGEAFQPSDDNGGPKVTQYVDDATIRNTEEDYVMVNPSDVPASNSQEVLESCPQNMVTNMTEQTNSIQSNGQKDGPVFNRKFIANGNFNMANSEVLKKFTVVSYNILAQCHLERNDYSFTSPEFLKLEARHQKMMSEFQYLDADIVCLQEVGPSYFENTLKPAMKNMGYTGLMVKRTQDYFDEGEATFWRENRFSLVSSEMHILSKLAEKEIDDAGLDTDTRRGVVDYLDKPDVLLLTQLRCNKTNNTVTVGNIHVQWGKMEVPDIQCIQIACAIKALTSLARNDASPHILCGDFNSESTSPGYQLVMEGYLSDDMIDKLQAIENVELPDGTRKALFNQLYRAFQHPSSNIKSSYLTAVGKEPTVTSYNRVMRAAVDYIFYSANCLETVGVLEVAPERAITETGGIPDPTFPSDHVSMKSTFSFV